MGLLPVLVLAAGVLLAAQAWGEASAASDPEVAAAEALVRARYYEGLPEELARACSHRCAARLIEMLEDPAEISCHSNILYVLGHSTHPGAHEALAAYAEREPTGQVRGAVYNARVQLLLSLGERARWDPRALQLLFERLERVEGDPKPPAWSLGSLRGEALREVMHHGIIRGLALSGRPEAGARLRSIESAARSLKRGDALLDELSASLELHERMSRGVLRGVEGQEGHP
jgi:hypothetical protein